MNIRVYHEKLGGHIHCRVFTSGSLNGTLVFDELEWILVQKCLKAEYIDELYLSDRKEEDNYLIERRKIKL